MKYNELQIGKQKKAKRAGRGISAGRGKTAGRGTKGQGSRKSGGVRPGFEGGQMPVYMRLPHLRGFKSKREAGETVKTTDLDIIKSQKIDNAVLFSAGLVGSPHTKVKIIYSGKLTTAKNVVVQGASKQASDAIKAAGGSFERINRISRPKKISEPKK